MNKKIVIYTDGSSIGNPGPGGLGIVMQYKDGDKIIKQKEISEGYRLTTNNRMELLAVIKALKMLNEKAKNLPIEIYTDSQYVSNAINNGWLYSWVQKNFKKVKNPDLWIELHKLLKQFKNISFHWVRGHNNNTLNERCDTLAKQGAFSQQKQIDSEYEQNNTSNDASR